MLPARAISRDENYLNRLSGSQGVRRDKKENGYAELNDDNTKNAAIQKRLTQERNRFTVLKFCSADLVAVFFCIF